MHQRAFRSLQSETAVGCLFTSHQWMRGLAARCVRNSRWLRQVPGRSCRGLHVRQPLRPACPERQHLPGLPLVTSGTSLMLTLVASIRYSIGVDTTCVRHYTGLNTTLKQRILSGKSWHNIAELVRLDARRQAYVLPMCYLRRYLHIC